MASAEYATVAFIPDGHNITPCVQKGLFPTRIRINILILYTLQSLLSMSGQQTDENISLAALEYNGNSTTRVI